MKFYTKLFISVSLLLITHSVFAQTEKTVNGTVTDTDGIPLPGANVILKGSSTGVVTDFDGNYSVKTTNESTLVFQFFGYKTQEVSVGSKKQINVVLEIEQDYLNEVIVTAIGIKREKTSIGAASTTISSDKLTEGAQTGIVDAIQGKVAGVVAFSASSDPGASSGLIVRGISSVGGSNQALYIVDGVPISNNDSFGDDLSGSFDFGRGIDDLNPEDIETMTIIKGASAAALYGSRAANGVVIVTTKKGKVGKLTIDISSIITTSNVLRVPNYQKTFGQGWDAQHLLGENGSWGPAFNGETIAWGNVVNNSQQIKPYLFQKDQLRNFYSDGFALTNNIAISGGKDGATGRLSFSNRDANGINPGNSDTNERNTLQMSFENEVDWLTFGGTFNYVTTEGSGVPGGQGLSVANNLLQIPTDLDISGFSDLNNPFNSVSEYFTAFGVTNPYFTLNNRGTNFEENRAYGAFNVTAKLTEWANLTYRLGLDNTDQRFNVFSAEVDALPGSTNDGSSIEQEGFYAEANINTRQINHDILLNINGDFNEDLSVDTNFGMNFNERNSTTSSVSISSLDIPSFYNLSNSASTPAIGSNSILDGERDNDPFETGLSKRKLFGFFSSTTFNYKDQLYLTGNIRQDWYSTLPSENRTALYGGVNSSWVFSKTFPIIQDIVNFGKLRLGYGETGVDTRPYQTKSRFVASSTDNQGFRNLNFPAGGLNAFEVGNRAPNPDLVPERRKEFEIGTELQFLKNRIGIDFTYFDAKVDGQIVDLPLAPSTGFTSQRANVATISNKGIELLLNLNWIKNWNGFGWKSSFNYSKVNGKLVELDDRLEQLDLGGLSTTALVARRGQPIALIEGNVALRDPDGRIVVDDNGVPIADTEKEIYGDTQYDYTLGISNEFSYKGVSLSFTLDSRQGGVMFSRTADITRFTGNSITTTFNNRSPFLIPNSVQVDPNNDGAFIENTTPIDREHQDDFYRADANDRQTVIDKSFIKLREVTLTYNVSQKILQKTPINKLSLALIGRNLALWTPESNQFIDPELSTFGTDVRGQFGEFTANPTTRSFSLNVKAQF